MKIKKLFILGFKSIMDRLEITFPLGISAIVGPNGCGKSNVVDAIRWCLGEQSPKQLRGRRMEDIIFNGAGDFGALGMAEVSLLFENGGGLLPSAFTQNAEISVTRRLYRSGESEYLINNVPCRLKDIQDVFMDTGVGNKAYSIISQGQIGTILEQKPEETRVMLEEVAGITRYRKKVESSQKKIELTEANLQRVEDILGEVLRQMRSLKIQASRAKRYKAISEEIQNLEVILYANTYHQLNEELGENLRSTQDLAQREITKSTELSNLFARIETMNLDLEEKDRALSRYRENHSHLRENVHKKEAALESLTGEMRMQDELAGRLVGEMEEIKDRLTGLNRERDSLERDKEKVKESSSEIEEKISLGEKRLKTRQELLKEIKESYEKARAELSAGSNKEVGLSHETSYLNEMLNQITDSRSRLEKELEDSNAKITNVIGASNRKSVAKEAAAVKLQEIEASIEQENTNCERLEDIKRRVDQELKSAEADLNVCQSQLATLQALTENFEGYKMGVRAIMKAKDLEPYQQGHILGLVADVVQVNPRYEQAIETVLADKLQYVIVESQEDGKQAVEYLKKRAKGRSSFISLKDLSRNAKDQIEDSQFMPLLDLVSVPETYVPLIDALLADTVLVEDLDSAVSAWKDNGRDRCFVTVEGDIVDRRGVISGGKPAQSSRGLLGRKREMAELKEKSVCLQEKAQDLRLKLKNIVTEFDQKKEILKGLDDDKWTYRGEIDEFDKMIFRIGQELDQLEKFSQRISKDIERKDKEQDKHRDRLLKIEKELHQCKLKRQEKEEYFRKKETELNGSEEEYEQFRDDVAKLKADCRIFKEEQRSLGREIERLDHYADDSLKRLRKIEEEISLGHTRRDECERRKETVREEIEEQRGKLIEAEENLNRADRERQIIQNGIKQEERNAEDVREKIDALKKEISRIKMEHSEFHFKMSNLAEVVKEKCNLNLCDIYRQYIDASFSQIEVEEKIEQQNKLRQRLGEVNLTAIREHEALKERHEFIKDQREDLMSSIESLRTAIKKINRTSLHKFEKAFQDVDGKLKEIFPILFNGGTAGLQLTNEANALESGVLVEVKPPGKKLSHMGLLSGGEKALVAIALIFAIYMIKPSPFCLFDEVDSPLDEANIDRFNNLLKELRKSSQIIVVTHNRRTMEITDRLYGITMEKPGISKLVSVDIQGMETRNSSAF